MAEKTSTTTLPRTEGAPAAGSGADDEPEVPVEYLDHPWIRPQTVERRAYQVHLAVTAAQYNTLVVLPTGLGKTVVALLVAADKLKHDPNGKVLILAPTKPLVEQHAAFFRDMLALPEGSPPDETVVPFSGGIPPERRQALWEGARVIAATPQVIENDLIAKRYDLRDVTLVIFDEVHRATGDYPYLWVADRFARDNPQGHRLGLTASPGAQADKILEICSQIGFSTMEIRTEADEDVRPYIHDLAVEWEKVPLPEGLKKVSDALNDALQQRIKALKGLDLLRHVSGSPNRRDLLGLATEIQRKIRASSEPDRGLFDAMSIQAQAMKISHAQELVETQGAQALLAYWQKLENEADGKGSSKATAMIVSDPRIKAAIQEARLEALDDPKTERVVDAVRAELVVADDPRIIVFANYRETCERLVERLGRIPGCKPVRFVGQASREGDKGLTQKEQKDLLARFRDGTFNVLVATSVAEEGLDIPQTDLVIFYEPVPSEIRAIQRRGRTARRRAGRAIVLMYAGTRDEAYHWAARRREQSMRRELRTLRNLVVRGLRSGETGSGGQQTRLQQDLTHADAAPAVPPTPPVPPTPTTEAPPPRPTPPKEAPQPAAPSANPPAQTHLHASDRDRSGPLIREHPEERPLDSFFRAPRGVDGRVRILVDHRESRSGVVRALERQGIDIETAQLSVADYALSDRVAVERKHVDDFLGSLLDGRLFQQARQLTAYHRPILVIEGEGLTTARNIPRASIFGALAALTADFGITIIQTANADETATLMVSIAKREQTEQRREAPVRLDKVSMTDEDRRRFLVEGLPNVSGVLARRLLAHFGSVQQVFSASVDDLMEVEGVGRKTAKEIHRVLTMGERGPPAGDE